MESEEIPMRQALALACVLSAGCAPLSVESQRDAFSRVEQCESEASAATGAYKAGTRDGRTWLEIKNDCLLTRRRPSVDREPIRRDVDRGVNAGRPIK
jgi:hypothetical protein